MINQSDERQSSAGLIITVTLIFSIGYAILRYHVVGPVPWKDFFFFILNKGISLSAFILLAFNFSLRPLKNLGVEIPQNWLNARKMLGLSAFLLVFIHVLMSLLLFSPVIYEKFFKENETLTLLARVSMLGGILAFIFLWDYSLSFYINSKEANVFTQSLISRKPFSLAFILGMIHLLFLDYKTWITPSGWHGGLPPISLIAMIFFVSSYTINLLGSSKIIGSTEIHRR